MYRLAFLIVWGILLPALLQSSEVVGLEDVSVKPDVEMFPPPAINDDNWPWCVEQHFIIDDSTKYFASGNYPQPYYNDQHCVWVLVSNIGSRIELKFEDFQTEGCCDYVTITGAGEDIMLKGNHSGKIIQLESYFLQVFLKTDADTSDRGFNASYKALFDVPTTTVDPRTDAPYDDCGGDIIVTKDGKINSPGFPDRYQGGLDCWWRLIAGNEDERIIIEFDNVETEPCCDYVKVFDGTKMLKKLQGSYNRAPVYSFTSTGNSIRIHFHTDKSNEKKGFSSYFAIDSSARIYPTLSSNDTSEEITATLPVFTSALAATTVVSTIQNVATSIFTKKEQMSTIPPTQTTMSTTTATTIISAESSFPPECGVTTLTASSTRQSLTSPDYPARTMLGILCTWTIKAPEMLQVELKFSDVDLNECCDFIEIEVVDQKVLSVNQFTYLPFNSFFSPPGGSLRVTYNAFGWMPIRGFSAVYFTKTSIPVPPTTKQSVEDDETTAASAAPSTTKSPEQDSTTPTRRTTTSIAIPSRRPKTCGRVLRKIDIGKVYVLLSPDQDNVYCRWRFRAARGLEIRLRFLEFEVDSQFGNFSILDAPNYKVDWNNIKIQQNVNGNRTGTVIKINHFRTAVIYNTISRQPGFTLIYESVLPAGDCGFSARATAKDRQLRSPGWPKRPFKGYVNCTWRIESTKEGEEVSFALLDFLAPGADDSLSIYDGEELIEHLQDSLVAPVFYKSTKGFLTISYVSSEHNELKGFSAFYKLDIPTPSPVTIRPTTMSTVETVIATSAATTTRAAQLLTEVTSKIMSTTVEPTIATSATATTTAAQLMTEVTTKLMSTTVEPTIATSATATTTAAQLLTEVTNKLTSTTDADMGIICYEIMITGISGLQSNKKTRRNCLPGEKCVLVKSEIRVGGTTIETVYGSCTSEEVCKHDACKQISEMLPMFQNNCTSSCCEKNLCNDYVMPIPGKN